MRPPGFDPDRERGAATIWVLAAAVLVASVSLAGIVFATAVLARHRVETAADLAALAGAGRIGVGGDPCQWAGRVALANQAQVRMCRLEEDPDGRSGTVTVSVSASVSIAHLGVRSATAVSRAGRLRGSPTAVDRGSPLGWTVAR